MKIWIHFSYFYYSHFSITYYYYSPQFHVSIKHFSHPNYEVSSNQNQVQDSFKYVLGLYSVVCSCHHAQNCSYSQPALYELNIYCVIYTQKFQNQLLIVYVEYSEWQLTINNHGSGSAYINTDYMWNSYYTSHQQWMFYERTMYVMNLHYTLLCWHILCIDLRKLF